MCGIFLFINKVGGITQDNIARVKLVCDEFIESRGPDFYNMDVGSNYIAYQSILSLSVEKTVGKEFRKKQTNNLFVGEIFKFRGEAELDYINNIDPESFDSDDHDGFYAFIWNKIEGKELYSFNAKTDPQGEKRLFYVNNHKYFVVSSMPGALVPFLLTRELSLPYFLRYLGGRHAVSYDDSIFSEIKQFKGGDLYHIDKNNDYKVVTDSRYSYEKWFDSHVPAIYSEVKDELDKRLTSTMNEFVSHGPNRGVGSIVSGGVDSSLQSHYLFSAEEMDIKYFTIQFLTKDCASSEITKFKEYIGINDSNHFSYNMSSEEYLHYAFECVKVSASPIPTHSMPSSMFLADKMRDEGIRHFYSGEGADELFLGYGTYLDNKNVDKYHSVYSKVIDEFREISNFDKVRKEALNICKNNLPVDLVEKELQLKVSSFMDFFIQCRSVGFYASDIGMSVYGMEGRTSFARRNIASLALSLPSEILLEPSPKQLLKDLYTDKLFNKPAAKAGFAGFPNEIGQSVNLPELNNKELGYFHKAKPFHNLRDYEWKVINYKFFKKYFNVELS